MCPASARMGGISSLGLIIQPNFLLRAESKPDYWDRKQEACSEAANKPDCK